MATTKLGLYNGALRVLGKPKLSAIDEGVENRRVLDDAYDDDAIKMCLEMGLWNFAMRTVKIEYDSSIDPDFGLNRAFTKPSDWVRTAEVASDEFFVNPLVDLEFKDEQAYFFADIDSIYVRYVSDDDSYGSDLSLWPQSFVKMFEAFLADQAAPRLIENKKGREEITQVLIDTRREARSKDALNEGVKFPPQGGWAGARGGRRRSHRDLGSRGALTS